MYTFDDIYYPGQIFRPENNALVKPSLDNALTMKKKGCRRMGFPTGTVNSINLAHLFAMFSARLAMMTMPSNKVIVLQYPYQSRIELLCKVARKKGNKIILLVHDINKLREFNSDKDYLLGLADVLIVHTPKMKKWVEEHYPDTKCVLLGVFDYITDTAPELSVSHRKSDKMKVVFAGNLFKAGFISKIKDVPDFMEYLIYGPSMSDNLSLAPGVIYKGVLKPDELPATIAEADFGLLWDGPDVEGGMGNFGEYMQYNIPYKASCYIASGLPLILWNKMSFSEFVLQEGIGILVSNLNEVPQRIAEVSDEDYRKMKENVLRLQKKILTGGFYADALKKSLEAINAQS